MADRKITPVVDTDKQAIREGYVQALADLELIQTTDLNTNNKLQLAVKKQAEIIEKLLRFIKRRLI